jgi:orotate phosphoribosyltransferase
LSAARRAIFPIFMDETSKALIERISLASKQPDGLAEQIFYDCRSLSPSDLSRLAAVATGHLAVRDFDLALGIAFSGILFAAAVAGGRQVAILKEDGSIWGPTLSGKKVLIVDDVVHSGSNLQKAEAAAMAQGADVVGYCCIVDGSHLCGAQLIRPLWSAYKAKDTTKKR